MKEYYQVTKDYKMSKNYNSIGGAITYGREAKSNEKRDSLVKDVEAFAEKQLFKEIKKADSLLNEVSIWDQD